MLSNKQKTRIVLDIRAKQPGVKVQLLFDLLKLNRKTYYDNVEHRLNQPDKYAQVKQAIRHIYFGEADQTYGYRPMWAALRDSGIKLAQETVRKLMRRIGIKTPFYSRGSRKYSSYKGRIGRVAPNILNQHFNEKRPYPCCTLM